MLLRITGVHALTLWAVRRRGWGWRVDVTERACAVLVGLGKRSAKHRMLRRPSANGTRRPVISTIIVATKKCPRPALILILALLPWLLYPSASARARVSAAVYCGTPVAVLGADLTDAGRREVTTVLRLTPATRQLTETLDDERAQAHGLIPPDLLGRYAISSIVLRPLAAGSGLTVTLRRAIRLDVAENYVNALLTLGVTDARVDVAAPYAQAALGTTALLGLIRAARSACTGISQAQVDFAIRGGVLNTALGANVATRLGYQVTPRLLFTLKLDATR